MLTKTKAIVLRNLKLGERKMIVDLLTENHGRLSVVMAIPSTQRGKLKKQYFQPMTVIDAELELRPRQDLHHLRDVRLAVPYASIPFHAAKLSITLFLGEFLCHATRGEQLNPQLFAYVEASLRWLDGCATSFANFHLVFMMRLTRFIGFFPFLEDYHDGDVFDLRAGTFASNAPMHTDFIPAVDAARIGTLMRMNYESMHLFKMNHDDRNRIVDVLVHYYRLHVPGFPELRSLDVMKELWE